jgi:hypothetical protein
MPPVELTPADAAFHNARRRKCLAGTIFDLRKPMPVGVRVREARDEQIAFVAMTKSA